MNLSMSIAKENTSKRRSKIIRGIETIVVQRKWAKWNCRADDVSIHIQKIVIFLVVWDLCGTAFDGKLVRLAPFPI